MKNLLAIVCLATALAAQSPSSLKLGGGCRQGIGALSFTLPRIGKPWLFELTFPEPVGARALLGLGFSDPNQIAGVCTIHTSADFAIPMSPAGTHSFNLPNHTGLLGLRLYVQASWEANAFPKSLSDGFKVGVGR